MSTSNIFMKSVDQNQQKISVKKYFYITKVVNGRNLFIISHIFVESKRHFKCGGCSRRYLSKTALNRHLRYDCGKQPTFKCNMCTYTAFQKIHLVRHQGAIHKILPGLNDEMKSEISSPNLSMLQNIFKTHFQYLDFPEFHYT